MNLKLLFNTTDSFIVLSAVVNPLAKNRNPLLKNPKLNKHTLMAG